MSGSGARRLYEGGARSTARTASYSTAADESNWGLADCTRILDFCRDRVSHGLYLAGYLMQHDFGTLSRVLKLGISDQFRRKPA